MSASASKRTVSCFGHMLLSACWGKKTTFAAIHEVNPSNPSNGLWSHKHTYALVMLNSVQQIVKQ